MAGQIQTLHQPLKISEQWRKWILWNMRHPDALFQSISNFLRVGVALYSRILPITLKKRSSGSGGI
eukprot:scaffold2143_cov125-Cylindrotheca_fusiformis.AAC.19